MQIHVTLIPIPNADQPPPGPDPPENIYHYTTGVNGTSKMPRRGEGRGPQEPPKTVCTFVCNQKPLRLAAFRTNRSKSAENARSRETRGIAADRCKRH
jgi:hypothetical protein